MTQERYVARFHAEKAELARHYCTVFKFWRDCPLRRCRRERDCCGVQHACLKRRQQEIPRKMQWRATPGNPALDAGECRAAGAHGARIPAEQFLSGGGEGRAAGGDGVIGRHPANRR
jgi:hypothetical protein